jgi:hypothetical protein
LTLAIQQVNGPVPQVAFEDVHQPVKQDYDILVGLEGCQAAQNEAESLGVSLARQAFDLLGDPSPAYALEDSLDLNADRLGSMHQSTKEERDVSQVSLAFEELQDGTQLAFGGVLEGLVDHFEGAFRA